MENKKERKDAHLFIDHNFNGRITNLFFIDYFIFLEVFKYRTTAKCRDLLAP